MRIKPFFYFVRYSIFSQLTLLTILFIGVFLYVIAFSPIIEYYRNNTLERTKQLIDREVFLFVNSEANGKGRRQSLQESKYIQLVMQDNPDFQYYIMTDEIVDFLGLPYLPEKQEFDVYVDAMKKNDVGRYICFHWHNDESIQDGVFFSLSYCNKKYRAYQFSGLTQPVATEQYWFDILYRSLRGVNNYIFFMAAGLFCIAFLIIFFGFKSLKRVAKVVEKIDDAKQLINPLPEDRLPYEAVPLVRAVNQMIGKIQQSKQQQEFFLSTTAHELRTPLTILRTRVELLDDGETKQQLIADIRRMTALVNQLLKLMRSGEPQELIQDIDIVQCCKKVISERALLAIDKGIELSFDCQPEKLMIKGDADLLEIALANLLDNAISFSTPGDEVCITLSAEGILQVKDQGPGIHPSLLPTLFEAFAKYPSTRNGHGLGLAIVKSVTRLHGAELSADNAPDGGAVFTITFKAV